MPTSIPLASHEVRWFFEGDADAHPALKRWFETAAPFEKDPGVGAPAWKGRLDGQPDVYLLVPGGDDLGIKWREGERQVKGRVASLGTQVFAGRHQGRVERWVKWSYPELPDAYRRLFDGGAGGPRTTSVRKTRAQRKVRLDPRTGARREVDAAAAIDRGLGAELASIEVGGRRYCSLAFEAFPDDAAMHDSFTGAVEAFLGELRDVSLGAGASSGYPGWLGALQ